ncbi:MAG: hypothetical protein ABW003_13675 [Microvirga sp.]
MRISYKAVGLGAFAALLAVSLGPKVVLAMSPATSHRPLSTPVLAAELERAGFRVVGTNEPRGLPSVEARSGGCDVLVTRAAPQGWNRSIIRETAGARRLTYLYDDAFYDEHPVLRTNLRFYWELLKRRSGFESHMPVVLALALADGCRSPPKLDLSMLRE